jgi:hypothetical protein
VVLALVLVEGLSIFGIRIVSKEVLCGGLQRESSKRR